MTNQTNNQTTNNQNVGGNNMNNQANNQANNQNVGGTNMSTIEQIGNLFLTLSGDERTQLANAIGITLGVNQAPANNGMVELAPDTFQGMIQEISQLRNTVASLTSQLTQVQAQLAQSQVAQPVQQAPQFTMPQGVMDANAIEQAILASQQQAPGQQQAPIQYSNIDPAKLNRIMEIEARIADRQAMYKNYIEWGYNTLSIVSELKRLIEEHNNLTGAGIKNKVVNGLDGIANYGQNRVANEFIPSMVNTTSSVIVDALNIGADLIQSLGNVAVNTASQVLSTGANTVGQVGTVVSNGAQSYGNTAFGMFRR